MLEKKSKKVLRGGIVAALTLASTLCLGCVSFGPKIYPVEIHPIMDTDIILVDKGDTFVAPSNGVFMSDTYVEIVLKAKVGK